MFKTCKSTFTYFGVKTHTQNTQQKLPGTIYLHDADGAYVKANIGYYIICT